MSVWKRLFALKKSPKADMPDGKPTQLAGSAAIHKAAEGGHSSWVEALLKGDPALVFSRDDAGWTPLHSAAVSGQKNVVELLLANKADVNAKNSDGKQPLHLAAESGHEPVAVLLLANGAEVNSRDSRGDTPMDHAAGNGHMDLAELLRQQGGTASKTFTPPPLDNPQLPQFSLISPASTWLSKANRKLIGDPEFNLVGWENWDAEVRQLVASIPPERREQDVEVLVQWLERVAREGQFASEIPHTIRLLLHIEKDATFVPLMVLAAFASGRAGSLKNSWLAIHELFGDKLHQCAEILAMILQDELGRPQYASAPVFSDYYGRLQPLAQVFLMQRIEVLALLLGESIQGARLARPLLERAREFALIHVQTYSNALALQAIDAAIKASA